MGTAGLKPETIDALRIEQRRLIDAVAGAPDGPNVSLLRVRRRIVDHLLRRYGGGDAVMFGPLQREDAAPSLKPSKSADAATHAAAVDLVPAVTPTVPLIRCPFDLSKKFARLDELAHVNTTRYTVIEYEERMEVDRRTVRDDEYVNLVCLHRQLRELVRMKREYAERADRMALAVDDATFDWDAERELAEKEFEAIVAVEAELLAETRIERPQNPVLAFLRSMPVIGRVMPRARA